jgi:hypothetical protein
MIQPSSKQLERSLTEIDGMVSRLSGALRGIAEFDRFLHGLEKTFEWISSHTGREIRFELPEKKSESESDPFVAPELTAPVNSAGRSGGYLRVSPPEDRRPFGPEDLHLLGSLAEFTGALIDVSSHIRESREFGDFLRLVYDQLPVGVVCFGPKGDRILCSARAMVLLGDAVWNSREDAVSYFEKHGTLRTDSGPADNQYLLPQGGGHVLVDLHSFQPRPDATYTVAILGDLKPHGQDLRDVLEREVYRCRWLARPLTFVVIQTQADPRALLSSLPDLRSGVIGGAVCDVFDGNRVGLVVPGREPLDVLRSVRTIGSLAQVGTLSLGWSALDQAGERPEDLIAHAVGHLRPADELLAPRLLVFDGYRAVADMIELVVRDRFRIDKVSDPKVAENLLKALPYDGLVLECDSDEGDAGIQLINAAQRFQPDMGTVITTTRIDLRPGRPPVPENARVVIKPFQVERIRESLDGLAVLNDRR